MCTETVSVLCVVLRRFLVSNQLSGTIPASLGSLTAVNQLFVHHLMR